jgi:MoaA/NifB/PqqE/SkfB family radical SAM enzyme
MQKVFPHFINDTKIIPQPNCCFVYSLRENTFDVFNYESLIFFNKMDGNTATEDISREIISDFPSIPQDKIRSDFNKLLLYLKSRKYLSANESPSQNSNIFEFAEKIDNVKIAQADIEFTKNCNLRCKYCFNEAGHNFSDMPLEKWVNLLEKLYKNGLRVIKVSGGEPFTHKDIIAFLDYVTDKFIVSVNTNGTFINKKIAHDLAQMRFQAIQVSLDSTTKELHDSFRGKGSWEKAINSIELLHDFKVPLRISTTVTAQNFDQLESLKAFANKYNAEISFEALKPVGQASILPANYFVAKPSEIKKYSDKSAVYKILEEMEMTCQAQLGIVGISYKGNIKPCNLTEDFFNSLGVDVINEYDTNFQYDNSGVYMNSNIASNKVISLLKRKSIKSKEKCIFEY